MLPLVETDINQLEVADILGEDDGLGAYGMVEDMVFLDVTDSLGELAYDFVENRAADLTLVDELAEGIAVDIIGDYRHPDPGDILEIVDHHDIRMAEIISDIKLLLDHLTEAGVIAQGGFEGLEHHPFAMFAGGVDIIELLVPFGEVFDLGPFVGLVFCHCRKGRGKMLVLGYRGWVLR